MVVDSIVATVPLVQFWIVRVDDVSVVQFRAVADVSGMTVPFQFRDVVASSIVFSVHETFAPDVEIFQGSGTVVHIAVAEADDVV